MNLNDIVNAAPVDSHKRTNSATENSTEPRETKRRNNNSQVSSSAQQHVYIVTEMQRLAREDVSLDEIKGVYMTIQDANNCVKRVAELWYEQADLDETSCGLEASEDGGRAYWHSENVGENGDEIEITITKHDLLGPDFEKPREFPGEAEIKARGFFEDGSTLEKDDDEDDNEKDEDEEHEE